MPLAQASAAASRAGRKRPHEGQQAQNGSQKGCGAAGSSPALCGKRQQPAAGSDSPLRAAEATVAQSAASAAQPQQEQRNTADPEQQSAAEAERDQQGAAPPAAVQDAEQPQAKSPPPPPPKLKPRQAFAPRSFYRQKAVGGSIAGDAGASGGGDALSTRVPTPRELYLETQVHRLLQAAKARQASWKEAEARHGPGAQPPPEVWETFPFQQPAFERADSLGLHVFSVEYGLEGKRRFVVASRAHFWQRYSGMVQRHYYEIIRAGAPCHLYFDLEFSREDNPGVEGAAAVDALLSLLRDELRDRFGLDMQDNWVLELDSSTHAKFSRHLLVRIPGAAFASNAHVGTLVLQLCASARERRDQDERCARLIVRKGEGEALFVDPAVYSRNRAFRLYLSSKSGKQTILDSTGRFGGAGLTQRDTFFAALITDVPSSARLLRCFEGETSDEAAVAASRRALSSRAGSMGSSGSGLSGLSGPIWLQAAAPEAVGALVSYDPCPYTELERFVCSVCCEGGVQGRVRSWVQLEDVMLFSMRDNRWCGNVGRPHKSNGIYIVVDLREGSWHQKCYDPECRHYRSPLMPLPPHLGELWQPPAEPAAGMDPGDAAGGAADIEAVVVASVAGTAGRQAPSSWDDNEEDGLMAQALDQFELQHAAAAGQQHQQQHRLQHQHQHPHQHQQHQQRPPQQSLNLQETGSPPLLQPHAGLLGQQPWAQQPRQQESQRAGQPLQAPAALPAAVCTPAAICSCFAKDLTVDPDAGRGSSADGGTADSAAAAVPVEDALLLEGLLQFERQAALPTPAVAAAVGAPSDALAGLPAVAAAAGSAPMSAGQGGTPLEAGQVAAGPAAAGASPAAAASAAAAVHGVATTSGAAEAAALCDAYMAAEAADARFRMPAAAIPSGDVAGAAGALATIGASASPATWPVRAGSLRHIFLRRPKQQPSGKPLQAAAALAAPPWQQQRQAVSAGPSSHKLEMWEKFL